MVRNLLGDVAHPGLRNAAVLWYAKKIENLGTPIALVEIGVPGNHVEMDVWMQRMLSELNDVGLRAADRCLNSARHVADQRSDLLALGIGEISYRDDVTSWNENGPPFDRASERVGNVPRFCPQDAVPSRS